MVLVQLEQVAVFARRQHLPIDASRSQTEVSRPSSSQLTQRCPLAIHPSPISTGGSPPSAVTGVDRGPPARRDATTASRPSGSSATSRRSEEAALNATTEAPPMCRPGSRLGFADHRRRPATQHLRLIAVAQSS